LPICAAWSLTPLSGLHSFDTELLAMEKKLRQAEKAAEKKSMRQTLELSRLQKYVAELRASNEALTDETAVLVLAKKTAEEETRKALPPFLFVVSFPPSHVFLSSLALYFRYYRFRQPLNLSSTCPPSPCCLRRKWRRMSCRRS
jgi:hypothetical protein